MEILTALQKIVLFSVSVDPDWSISVQASMWFTIVLATALICYFLWHWIIGNEGWSDFEVDQAEIGVGTGKLTLKPNRTDRQVAYSIWVELSTRKIGLPIDFEHDVIVEIYDSWYALFSVTRELLKSVPANKVRHDSTQKIVNLSIEVLNEGLRPHLTTWQARFRRWYELEISKANGDVVLAPQDIQRKFPQWQELQSDMERVNQFLMNYRKRMRALFSTA
jgi:hypothetical protein